MSFLLNYTRVISNSIQIMCDQNQPFMSNRQAYPGINTYVVVHESALIVRVRKNIAELYSQKWEAFTILFYQHGYMKMNMQTSYLRKEI